MDNTLERGGILMIDAFTYFQAQVGLRRLLTAVAAKYESLGRLSGSVRIPNLTSNEREEISNFLRVGDIASSTEVCIPISQVVKAYDQSKFADVPLLSVLEYIVGRQLVPKGLKKQFAAQCKDQLLRNILKKYDSSTWCQQWLTAIQKKHLVANWVWRQYKANPKRCKEVLDTICKAIYTLEKKQGQEHLSVFACKVGKNPHLFDLDTVEGKGLYHALKFLHGEKLNEKYTTPESIHDLYKCFGLLRDNIINPINVVGIIGYDQQGREIPVLRAACESNFRLSIPLRELEGLSSAKPYLPSKTVFITENPPVYATILEKWEQKRPFPPVICTAGNLRAATLRLLRALARSGCHFLYSGDFDPEGLLAADKLLQLFPRQARLWRLTKENYIQHCSKNHTPITDQKRIRSLESISNPDLQSIVKVLAQCQYRVVSEEELIPDLIKDINNSIPLFKQGDAHY